MPHLHEKIQNLVTEWRQTGYLCDHAAAIAEILEWARDPENGQLRYLRAPQLRALETYWYLRLVKNTPHIYDLYRQLYPRTTELLDALGLTAQPIRDLVTDEGVEALWDRIRTDDEFVRAYRLEALRETLTLDYASYILALAMGAGKTILIGAIVATEFALALEYAESDFVENALVFAPGKTIIESLRELLAIPYEKILPPRFHRGFVSSVKFTFTRDGEKDLPVIRGSSFNVIVTNTEKIRIQRESIRKSDLGPLFGNGKADEARAELANLRLQAVASLPHLAVFSDEAHHTYGQTLGEDLKKVRKTVDYLANQTNLLVVVNTTGTPYFQRQPLRDVVIWYGLSEGIRDGILKDVANSIQAFDFDGDATRYVGHVVRDFFQDYGAVQLPNGAPAKLAIYFPQTTDLATLRPVVDEALVAVGQSPAVCLVNTSDGGLTKQADVDAFNRLNDPASPYRVILLVNKGTEGWNCPSLFACALARRLRTSNNFVLQAATRCLRQVPGNSRHARIYLSQDNFGILDRQLRETYGESIADLIRVGQESRQIRIVLRKPAIPPLVVRQTRRTVVRLDKANRPPLTLTRPATAAGPALTRRTFTLQEQVATPSPLAQRGIEVVLEDAPESVDRYAAATQFAGRYRLDLWEVYDAVGHVYPDGEIPDSHLEPLARQIESQTQAYETRDEVVDVALALVKPEGFDRETVLDGEVYTAEIVYPKGREHLLLSQEDATSLDAEDRSFHYSPYDFDSNPEKSFLELVLGELKLRSSDVEEIYFTGALTNPARTDFFVEYKDDKGKWRRYTPDFLIRKRPAAGGRPGTGPVLIVEIKREHDRDHPVDGKNGRKAMAVRKWEGLDPERLRYHMLFPPAAVIPADQMADVMDFISTEGR